MPVQARPSPLVRRSVVACVVLAALVTATALVGAARAAVDDPPLPTVAFVARADNPVDALAAAGVAGQLGAPLYLSFPDALHPDAEAGLAATDPDVVVLAGGTAALSEQVAQDVADLLPDATVIRKAGSTRTSTAVALSELAEELGFERPVLTGATVPGDAGVAGEMTVSGVDVAASIVELQSFHAPSDAVPVYCVGAVAVGRENIPACSRADNGDRVTPVADGSFVAVTDVIVNRNNLATTGDYAALLGVDDSDQFPGFPRIDLHGTALAPFQHTSSAPLIVLTAGERLSFYNDTTSDMPLDLFASGWMTSDLSDLLP